MMCGALCHVLTIYKQFSTFKNYIVSQTTKEKKKQKKLKMPDFWHPCIQVCMNQSTKRKRYQWISLVTLHQDSCDKSYCRTKEEN